MEQANFSELKEKINNWDIQAEELLIQKMKLFTFKYNEEFQQISKNFDNFSNSISAVEVDHIKAINQLKTLSSQRFIEQTLDKKIETEPETINDNQGLSNEELIKKAMEISLENLESFSKNSKKEQIEDDAASLQSSRITMDKNAKGVKLPSILGTEEFGADKYIGLNVIDKSEEEEKEDSEDSEPDIGELNIAVNAKQKQKWEKAEKKRKKKKEKEKQKLLKEKKEVKNEEAEIKVPIENEEETQKINEKEEKQDSGEIKITSAKTGGSGTCFHCT